MSISQPPNPAWQARPSRRRTRMGFAPRFLWLPSPCLPLRGPSADLTPLLPHRHIENWRGLHTLHAVDMELYTGLQKL